MTGSSNKISWADIDNLLWLSYSVLRVYKVCCADVLVHNLLRVCFPFSKNSVQAKPAASLEVSSGKV